MSACDVLFLVKNGCGLGHIRRVVLLSKELHRSGISSVIFSQASSLALYDDPDLRVINFPLLERLSSSAAEEAYASLLDVVAARLDPRIVIEDTYPDSRYLSIPSLRGLPRILVLRRLDPVSFEHVRSTGGFSHYNRVLVVQDRSDFDAEPHTPASRRLVESSGTFTFCGPVFYEPDSAEISRVENDFELDDQPLVVVTAGSGGDQLNDAYADRLFANAHRVAAACHQRGQRGTFVLVQGPYYRGRRLPSAPNVRIVGFEPRLAALLRRATIVLMRPGHNVAYEALGGDADLVLVPGIPWMEGQQEFAERLAEVAGATVAEVDDYHALEHSVLQVLEGGVRRRRPVLCTNGTANTAAAIAAELESERAGPSARARRQLVVIEPPLSLSSGDAAHTVAATVSADIPIVGRGVSTDPCLAHRIIVPLSRLLARGANGDRQDSDTALFVDVEMPAGLAPHQLAQMGALCVLYPDEGDVGLRMRRWLSSAGTSRPLLVDAPLARVVADARRTRHLGWCLHQSSGIRPGEGLLLDCTQLGELQFDQFLGALHDWLDHLQLEPLSIAEFTQQRVRASYLALPDAEKT